MSCAGQNEGDPHERQPLHEGQEEPDRNSDPLAPPANDANQTGQSLIRHVDDTAENDMVSPYQIDPALVSNAYENPYKETTDTTQNFIRRVPSADLVPSPFKKFNHVIILSIVSAIFFFVTGIFAVRLARAAKTQHSKGLYGLAQRDSKKAVILSYLGITISVLIIIIVVIVVST